MATNLGLVFQKRAIDRLGLRREGSPFWVLLVREPLWLTGILTQIGLGTTCLLVAQALIGPALIPGLVSAGLIVLVGGSILIAGERPTASVLAGTVLLMGAPVLVSCSRMSIHIRTYDFANLQFLARAGLSSAGLLVAILALQLVRRRLRRHLSRLLMLEAGFLLVLSNLWIGPFVAILTRLLLGGWAPGEAMAAAGLGAVQLATNLLGTAKVQLAFRHGQVGQLVPVKQIPIQMAPAALYLLVFRLRLPSSSSLAFLAAAFVLILCGSALLLHRRKSA
jgi:hypothetical protein